MKEKSKFSGILNELIEKAIQGSITDIDFILSHLNSQSTLEMTRYIDFALSLVEKQEGISRIEYYLFEGSLIQRNYCSLYFNRRGDWAIVKKAYLRGLIDEIQAFVR